MNDMFQQILKLRATTRDLAWTYWHEHTVFTFQWWFLIGCLILPWVLTVVLADRSRLKQLVIVYFMITMFSYMMDQAGSSLLLWTYPYTVSPLPREIFDPADLAILPFFYMMLYQLFTSWKVYLVMSAVFSLFAAYIGSWPFEATDTYALLQWRNSYSVPIYFLLALLSKSVVDWIDKTEKRHKE